jgi:hypothetical protein
VLLVFFVGVKMSAVSSASIFRRVVLISLALMMLITFEASWLVRLSGPATLLETSTKTFVVQHRLGRSTKIAKVLGLGQVHGLLLAVVVAVVAMAEDVLLPLPVVFPPLHVILRLNLTTMMMMRMMRMMRMRRMPTMLMMEM